MLIFGQYEILRHFSSELLTVKCSKEYGNTIGLEYVGKSLLEILKSTTSRLKLPTGKCENLISSIQAFEEAVKNFKQKKIFDFSKSLATAFEKDPNFIASRLGVLLKNAVLAEQENNEEHRYIASFISEVKTIAGNFHDIGDTIMWSALQNELLPHISSAIKIIEERSTVTKTSSSSANTGKEEEKASSVKKKQVISLSLSFLTLLGAELSEGMEAYKAQELSDSSITQTPIGGPANQSFFKPPKPDNVPSTPNPSQSSSANLTGISNTAGTSQVSPSLS